MWLLNKNTTQNAHKQAQLNNPHPPKLLIYVHDNLLYKNGNLFPLTEAEISSDRC